MKISYYILFFVMVSYSCKEKYMPQLHVQSTGYLVVEGFINVGTGSTRITLTQASNLDSIVIIPETGAKIEVQSQNGAVYPLLDTGGGNYLIDQVPAVAGQQYRLHIVRSNGKEYVSDYSTYKSTPEIDSVTWRFASDQVGIYVNTHDPSNQSVYYQWGFEETWQYSSRYISDYKYNGNGKFVIRYPQDYYNICWSSDISNNISIATSAALSSDVISEFLLLNVPVSTSNKLVSRYSILVKQHAISKDWYEWLQKVKRNTEQLGTIFDAQPSEVGGNIHSISDPSEMVIGFVGCTTETSKRIFILRGQIPVGYVKTGYEGCSLDTFPPKTIRPPTVDEYFSNASVIPIDFLPNFIMWTMITTSDFDCVDCRAHGGTPIEPDFW